MLRYLRILQNKYDTSALDTLVYDVAQNLAKGLKGAVVRRALTRHYGPIANNSEHLRTEHIRVHVQSGQEKVRVCCSVTS